MRRVCTQNDSDHFTLQQLKKGEIHKIVQETGSSGRTPERTLERVLQELRDLDEIEFLERGSYRRVTLRSGDGKIKGETKESIEAVPESEIEIQPEPEAEHIIGDGPECVYVYYYPAYKELAKLKGKSSWPCKIGRTAGMVTGRLQSQATGMPEKPRLSIVFNTDNSETWEQILHGMLKVVSQKHIREAPGQEWFDTTPEKILEMIRSLRNGPIPSC